jgi:hypothetical protein
MAVMMSTMALFRRHKRSPGVTASPETPLQIGQPAVRRVVSAPSSRGVPFQGEPHEPSRQDWSKTRGGRPWAPATWLAYPTLTHGSGSQNKLAGAYHHRAEIHDAYERFGGFLMPSCGSRPRDHCGRCKSIRKRCPVVSSENGRRSPASWRR